MKLDKYISELLFEHECVIIPGFGGLVSNTKPAFLNPARHTFSPPSKRLAFNVSLKNNDGLLANHISSRLDVNYNEANSYINEFVKDCTRSLESGEKLILEKIGVVYLDEEKNLQFMPDTNINYLKSSFGLFTLHSPPILREEQQAVSFMPEKAHAGTKKIRKFSSWRLIEVVPVAAMLGLLMLNPSVISRLNEQVASVNPFAKGIDVNTFENNTDKNAYIIPAGEKVDSVDSAIDVSKAPGDAFELPEEPQVIRMQPDLLTEESNISPAAEIEEEKPVELRSSVEPLTTQKLYYVIGGCFSIDENAQGFLQQSLNDGHQAAIIGRNKNGLIMVSLYSTSDRQAALSELEVIRQKSNASAWLLKM